MSKEGAKSHLEASVNPTADLKDPQVQESLRRHDEVVNLITGKSAPPQPTLRKSR